MSTTFEKTATSTGSIPRATAERVSAAEPQSPDTPNANANANAEPKLHTKRQVRGAAVAGGVTGLVLLGPAGGLLAAGGAALATTKGKGKIGEAARATGDSISDLGKSVKKFDEKHHIKEKTSATIVKGCNWISKKLDKHKNKNKHNINNTSSRDVM